MVVRIFIFCYFSVIFVLLAQNVEVTTLMITQRVPEIVSQFISGGIQCSIVDNMGVIISTVKTLVRIFLVLVTKRRATVSKFFLLHQLGMEGVRTIYIYISFS